MLLRNDGFGRLCRARDLLHETGLSIEAIAREVGVSPFHFIRQYEAVFGATPHQFRIQSRLDRARVLLARGQSVTEVCFEVGFESLGSFSSLFARRTGESPSEYRKRARILVPAPGILPPAMFPGCFSLMAAAFRNIREAPRV